LAKQSSYIIKLILILRLKKLILIPGQVQLCLVTSLFRRFSWIKKKKNTGESTK